MAIPTTLSKFGEKAADLNSPIFLLLKFKDMASVISIVFVKFDLNSHVNPDFYALNVAIKSCFILKIVSLNFKPSITHYFQYRLNFFATFKF